MLPSFAETEEHIFEAELVRIQFFSKFEGTAKVTHFDPRFVTEFKLLTKVIGLGEKGAIIAFAIHSPAREIQLTDYTPGQKMRLNLSRKKNSKRFTLRRAPAKPTEEK